MTASHTAALVQHVLRCLPGIAAHGTEIDAGFAEVTIACEVANTTQGHGVATALLRFRLTGGGFGETPVVTSFVGYGRMVDEAIEEGATKWCSTFGPLLRAATASQLPGVQVPSFDYVLRNFTFRVFVSSFDRGFALARGVDLSVRMREARSRLAGTSWITRVMLDSGRLRLPRERLSVVNVFVSEAEDRRVVEVKVDGSEIQMLHNELAHADPEPPGAAALLYELAIAVPQGPVPHGPTVKRRRAAN